MAEGLGFYLKELFKIAVHVVLATFTPQQTQISYAGTQVWRTMLKLSREYAVIQRLESHAEVSIWKMARTHVDYLIHSQHMPGVIQVLDENKMTYIVLIEDVQSNINSNKMSTEPWADDTLRIGHRLNWKKFPSLEVINEYIEYLKENYPSICKISTIGYSVESRPIQLVHVSNGDPTNTPIVIISGQHAREWISITTSLYVLNNLVTKFDKQPDYMKSKDWYIVPLVNPDGYLYTSYDRMWRKNRRLIHENKGGCIGIDVNRNWDKSWLHNTDYCAETYSGSKPFSEPELHGLRDLIQNLRAKSANMAFVDIHSYGQLIGYPWGFSHSPSEHTQMLNFIAAGMSEAAFNATRHKYEYNSAFKLFPNSNKLRGVSIDWVHSIGVIRAFVIEARDTGYQGFMVGEDQIEGNGIEILAALRFLAKDMEPYSLRSNYHHKWF